MPELPDLEIVREVLASRLTGRTISGVEVVRPDAGGFPGAAEAVSGGDQGGSNPREAVAGIGNISRENLTEAH
jgi:hypothetical protein